MADTTTTTTEVTEPIALDSTLQKVASALEKMSNQSSDTTAVVSFADVKKQLDGIDDSVSAAATSATNAAKSETNAASSAETAQTIAAKFTNLDEVANSATEANEAAAKAITAASGAETAAANAEDNALKAQSYATGDAQKDGVDYREGQAADNAKYYYEQTKTSAEAVSKDASTASTAAKTATDAANRAVAVSGVDLATTSTAGLVKPDGTTIKIADDGTISAESSIQVKVTFDEAFKGAEYSITGGDESYTGTVPDGLVVIQKVKSYNTTYTVKSTANSQEYTSTVATGQYAGEYATVLNTFTATIQVTVTASAAAASGATVKAKSGANEYTATTNASGVAEVKVHNTGEYSITATYGDYNEGTGDSVTISADGESVSSSVALFGAVLKVTADISSATATDASKVTVSDGTHNFEKTITATSTFSFTIYNAGTYKINMTNGTDTAAEVSVDVLEDGAEYPANVSYLKIVTWADGTDEEVAAMVAAADKGAIKLSDYWGVGDERKVKLSAMAATGVSETQAVQEVTMVLMNVGGVTLQNGKECNFVVGQKNSLATGGYMNSSNTNSGSWGNCARRKWCNEVYFKALPEYFQNMLKMMETKTPLAEGAGAEVQTVEDMIALPASAQVWKDDATAAASRSDGYSYCAREDFNIGLEQWEWFKTPANRVKKQGDTGSAYDWWERSPSSHPSYVGQCFCAVGADGGAGAYAAAGLRGLAPFGCI